MALLVIREPGRHFMLIDFSLMRGARDLHVYLGCDPAFARRILKDADDEFFVRHHIPKKGKRGGTREVWEARDDRVADLYKGLSRRLDEFIRKMLPGFPHASAHGYLRQRSTWTNANAHIGSDRILKADIASFFRSISHARVVELFRKLRLTPRAASVLASVVVRENHLPLGLQTSPLLANAVCHDLDRRLAALVPGGRYTRYADDLSFSGPSLPTKAAVQAELQEDGFKLADEKWRLLRAGRGLYVTGLSIEDRRMPRVPKEMKRRLRQDLYYAERFGLLPHLGTRGYGSLQSGINKIDGLIRYVRGIEPGLGLAFYAKWSELLEGSGCTISYAEQGAVVPRDVLFLVDESVVEGQPHESTLILALVVVEDTEIVRKSLSSLLKKLMSDPFGTTGKDVLTKKGLHWNDLTPDDRTIATDCVRELPLRCFLAYARLRDQDRRTYNDTYQRLLVKLIQGRLVRYDRCVIEVVAEQNDKVDLAKLSKGVAQSYEALAKANSRRPTTAPTVRMVPKRSDVALPVPDIILGIVGDYACSAMRAAAEKTKKKRAPGKQADHRFEKVRDKVRAIFDLDSGQVFSRRNPFRPWAPAAPTRAGRGKGTSSR